MSSEATDLAAWEKWLRLAEADLQARERQALADDPTPEELSALAAERDKIALDRDTIADLYDEAAAARDRSALRRDAGASARDRHARSREQDRDVAWSDRFTAGEDRDFAAGDRGDSHDERHRAREARKRAAADRERAAADRDRRDRTVQEAAEEGREVSGLRVALESRIVIGQAQGLLMACYSLSPDSAFAVLIRLSQERNRKLRDVAAQLVAEASAEGSAGVEQVVQQVDQ